MVLQVDVVAVVSHVTSHLQQPLFRLFPNTLYPVQDFSVTNEWFNLHQCELRFIPLINQVRSGIKFYISSCSTHTSQLQGFTQQASSI